MGIYIDGKMATLYKGDYKPVNLYLGDKKAAGWRAAEHTGTALEWDNTYNDTVTAATVYGDSIQSITTHGANVVDVYRWLTLNDPDNPSAGTQSYKPVRIGEYKMHCWGTAVANNAWVGKNLKPSTTYYVSFRLKKNDNQANGYNIMSTMTSGIYLYSGVSGYNTVVMARAPTSQPLVVGETVAYSVTITTPAGLYDAAANYRLLGYSERWTNASGQSDYAVITMSDIMISEINIPYIPYIPDSPSNDYPSAITSAGAHGGIMITSNGVSASRSIILRSLPDGTKDTWNPMTGVVTRRIGIQSIAPGSIWEIIGAEPDSIVMCTHRIPTTLSGTTLTIAGGITTEATVLYRLATPKQETVDPMTIQTFPRHTEVDAGGAEITATARVVDA